MRLFSYILTDTFDWNKENLNKPNIILFNFDFILII